jgi:hypothetical protein
MNPEDFNYFQSRVSRFITGSNRRSSSGSFLSPRITRLSGIIPKRALPSQIFSRPTASADDAIESSGRGISSLGRVTLDLEIINNNLDRIRQIIEQDYKNTQETNRKETEDFRKRVANRGRIFGRRELGDKKSDVLGSVKKYVGSFFSGTGGAIRALAMFNLLQGILSGDPSKIIGPLLGIGLTYIPAIATGIAGAVATSLVGKLFGGGGGSAAAATAAAPAATKVPRLGKLGKFAAGAALIGGGAALASNLFGQQKEDTQQQRLEELTQQQKGLTDAQGLVPIPQDDLKRFENLNKRFEAALDFLMGKKGGQGQQGAGSGGGGGGITAPPGGFQSTIPTGNEKELLKRLMIAEAGGQGELGMAAVARSVLNRSGLVQSGKTGAGTFGAASGSVSDIISASGQYSPYAQGKLNRALTAAENARAEKALELAMNEADMRGRLEAMGLQANQINNLISATGFRAGYAFDDPSQNVNVTKLGDHYFNTAGNVGRVSAAGSTSLQTSTLPTAASRAQRQQIYIPPQRQAPNVTLVPVDSGNQTPSSVASPSNHSAISVDTTHPENFLALYSKLIYQVV